MCIAKCVVGYKIGIMTTIQKRLKNFLYTEKKIKTKIMLLTFERNSEQTNICNSLSQLFEILYEF